MNVATLFVTGALTFGVAQALWSLGHAQGLWRGTWMMKTGTGIAACFVIFVVMATIACAFRERGRGISDSIVAIVAGAAVAAMTALFIVGPGGLWPLVIMLDTVIIALGVSLGAAFSPLVRRAVGAR